MAEIQYGRAYSGTACTLTTDAGWVGLPRLTLDDVLMLPEADGCPACGRPGSTIEGVSVCYRHALRWRAPTPMGLD